MPNLIEQHQHVTQELDHFFNEFPEPGDIEKTLVQLLHITLASEETEMWSHQDRAHVIFVVERVDELVGNLRIIHKALQEAETCGS